MFQHTHYISSQIDSQNKALNIAGAISGEPGAELARKDAENGSYAGKLAKDTEAAKINVSNDLGANNVPSNGQSMQLNGQSNYDGMQVEQNGMEWPNMQGYNQMLQSQNGISNMNWNWMPNMMSKINEQAVFFSYMFL